MLLLVCLGGSAANGPFEEVVASSGRIRRRAIFHDHADSDNEDGPVASGTEDEEEESDDEDADHDPRSEEHADIGESEDEEGLSGDEDGEGSESDDNEEGDIRELGVAASKWKEQLVEKATDSFLQRRAENSTLMELIYGDAPKLHEKHEDIEGEESDDGSEDDFFTVKKSTKRKVRPASWTV